MERPELPRKLKRLARKHAAEFFNSRFRLKTINDDTMLYALVYWIESPEGDNFWKAIYYNNYDNLEKKHLKNL